MIDWNLVKDSFTIIGIGWVVAKTVFGFATLIDKVKLWGFKKGMKKWLES
jgi:hypothetical protein